MSLILMEEDKEAVFIVFITSGYFLCELTLKKLPSFVKLKCSCDYPLFGK